MNPSVKKKNLRIPPDQEIAMKADATTYRIPLKEGLTLIITNIFDNQRANVWFVALQSEDLSGHMSYPKVVEVLGWKPIQTDAWLEGRKFIWAVYQIELLTLDLPF